MIKKITLVTVAITALLFIPAQAEGHKCAAGKSESEVIKKSNKMKRRGHGSLLLIRLPSPMRMLVKMENDPKLALTSEQKTKFEAQRNEMMPQMMQLKKEIKALKKEIIVAFKKAETSAQQKVRVEKLGQLKTEATLFKLTCIDRVRETLSKEQVDYMKKVMKAKMAKMKERRK